LLEVVPLVFALGIPAAARSAATNNPIAGNTFNVDRVIKIAFAVIAMRHSVRSLAIAPDALVRESSCFKELTVVLLDRLSRNFELD
jgi:hypothetical protein